jgi:glutaminyl-tRNA synthetase
VSTANTSTEIARFEQSIRQYLEGTAPRLLMVMHPLKVTISNLPDDYTLMVDKPLHPKVPELGNSKMPFTRTIYIEADDFRLQASDDYFRLSPGKTVGLFQAPHPITCTSYKTDETGKVVEVICRYEDSGNAPKPKAYIQWVAEHAASGSPVRIDEVRIYHRLFKSDNPSSDFRSDVNPDSLEVVKGSMVEIGFWTLAQKAIADARKEFDKKTLPASAASDSSVPNATVKGQVGNECVRFQALRVGYFALDKDARVACLDGSLPAQRSADDSVILNRIVTLKEDSGKAA